MHARQKKTIPDALIRHQPSIGAVGFAESCPEAFVGDGRIPESGECMEILELRRLFAYDSWANREVLTFFSEAGSRVPRAIKLMAHILGAEETWYSRIRGQKPLLPVWPELEVKSCQQEEERLRKLWASYLDELTIGQLSTPLSYKNSKGESWTSRIEDILMHVVMHSAYHRGQIASEMRGAGYTPAYTDFIHGVRQGLIE
jgi:uncharacterized damage-inducible protein DinB